MYNKTNILVGVFGLDEVRKEGVVPEENTVIKQGTASNPAKQVLSYLHDIVYLLAAIVIALLFVFRVVVVSGGSMNNTLVDGDMLILVSSVFYTEPQQGDIIVACKDSFRDGEPIIKRVIAVEDQIVDIDFSSGKVYVDGVPLDEPYAASLTTTNQGTRFPLTVPKGCVFVLGDNRIRSQDSRSTEIGVIDNREILGKAVFLLLPGTNGNTEHRDFNRFGGIS